MSGETPATLQPRVTHCPATFPTHPQRPCTEWAHEFDKQARTVAGGGIVAGRIAKGGMVAARSVSDRAAESLQGVHRCCRVHEHPARHGTPHMCECRFEWSDSASDPVGP
jgi:hypothetical protein